MYQRGKHYWANSGFVSVALVLLIIYGCVQVLKFNPANTWNTFGVIKFSGFLSNISYPKAKKNFSVDVTAYLKGFNLDLKQIVATGNTDKDSRTVFVTGSSSNHFFQLFRMIRSFHSTYPNETILVYNLGLTPDSVKHFTNEFPFAQVVPFNFALYPRYVQNLFEFRWKPLIIAEVLARNPKVLWMDTSTVLKKPISPAYFDGVRMFEFTGHSLLATTHPGMYDYLPTGEDKTKLEDTFMYGANVIAILNSKDIKLNVLRWWVLCALEADCMAPKGSKVPCNDPIFHSDPIHVYADCHRFDQSALNLLLAHFLSFNTSLYTGETFYQTDRS